MKKALFLINGHGDLEWVAPIVNEFKKSGLNVLLFFNIANHDNLTFSSELLNKKLLHAEKIDLITFFVGRGKFSRIIRYLGKIKFIDKATGRILSYLINAFSNAMSDKLIKISNPSYVFHDIGSDTSFRYNFKLKAKKQGSNIIVHPHGSEVFVENVSNNLDKIPNYLLASNEIIKTAYKKNYPNAKPILVGLPKLDEGWLEKKMHQKKEGKKVLFIARGPHPTDLSQEDYEFITEGLFKEIEKHRNIELIIKPHPRYGEKDLIRKLKKYKSINWKIYYGSLNDISTSIDLSVSMWSTLIVDCILLNIPVIEFFIYKNNANRWFKSNGKAISGYSKYNLLQTIDDPSQLEEYFLMSSEELFRYSKESKESLKKILDMSYIRNIKEKLLNL